jgi:serine/threonine protein kinase
LVVADFGIAHFEEENLATAVKTKDADKLANFKYSAPEQRVLGQVVDARADMFALGLILNEMFTGQVPQGTGHKLISTVAPQYSFLDPVVEKMIRQDPQERPQSIGDVKNSLIIAGAEAVTLQKLDMARRATVPVATPDDPLGGRDVTAMGFEYSPGYLSFRFDPPPPPDWMDSLHNIGAFGSYPGLADPTRVESLGGGYAQVPAREHIVAEIATFVRQWTQSANAEYRKRLSERASLQERKQREALAEQRRVLEERARAMERLRSANLG